MGEASFLTDDEKRQAAGYEPLPAPSLATLRAKYDPNQPRVPAGVREGGQWTDGGGGYGDSTGDDRRVLSDANPDEWIPGAQYAQGYSDPDKRYSINLEEEDKRGGHGEEKHVGKTDEQLLEVLRKDWIRRYTPNLEVTVFQEAEGSFNSLLEANDVVNQALQRNKDLVDLVATGRLDEARFHQRLGYPTGREAFRPNGDSEPYVRPTYGVYIIIKRDPSSPRGYRVHTAYPVNR